MAKERHSTWTQEERAREIRERRRKKQMQIIRRRRMTLAAIMLFMIVLIVIIIVSTTQKKKEVIDPNPDFDEGTTPVVTETQEDTQEDTQKDSPLVDPNVHALENGQNYTVVIDPGHGGKDSGGAHGDTTDKAIALSIGLKLRTELQKRNINVEMTRDDDTFIKLEDRVSFAESVNADLFISLHSDSYEQDSSVHGLTVHYPYQQPERSAYASLLHDNIAEADIIRVRDLKNTDLYVIMNTTMMATLVECGYLSNPDDLEKLMSEEFQQELAVIMADSVVEYFETTGGQAE